MERRADKLDKKADKLDAKGKPGGDALRSKADSLRGGVTALRSDGSPETGGYVANAVTREDKADVGAWTSPDGRTVTVNLANSSWSSSSGAQWAIGHESLHSAGLKDQRWGGPTGPKAFKRGDEDQRDAYSKMKGTPQADINPDHIMDEIY
jgi:hypothetical protein